MKRAILAALLAAGCAEEKKEEKPRFAIDRTTVTLDDMKASGLTELTAVVWSAPSEGSVVFELKQEKHQRGRIEIVAAFDAAEALQKHRAYRQTLEAEPTHRVRDRDGPPAEPFLLVQDTTGPEPDQRDRVVMIAFVWRKYVVHVTLRGEADDALELMERRAARVAGWLKERLDQRAQETA